MKDEIMNFHPEEHVIMDYIAKRVDAGDFNYEEVHPYRGDPFAPPYHNDISKQPHHRLVVGTITVLTAISGGRMEINGENITGSSLSVDISVLIDDIRAKEKDARLYESFQNIINGMK